MHENSALLEMSAIMTDFEIIKDIISTRTNNNNIYLTVPFLLKVMQEWEYKKPTRLKSNHSDVSFSFNNSKAVIKAVRVQFSSNKHKISTTNK